MLFQDVKHGDVFVCVGTGDPVPLLMMPRRYGEANIQKREVFVVRGISMISTPMLGEAVEIRPEQEVQLVVPCKILHEGM